MKVSDCGTELLQKAYDEAVEEMRKLLEVRDNSKYSDVENDHIDADRILVNFIIAIRGKELVSLYDKFEKWYS